MICENATCFCVNLTKHLTKGMELFVELQHIMNVSNFHTIKLDKSQMPVAESFYDQAIVMQKNNTLLIT